MFAAYLEFIFLFTSICWHLHIREFEKFRSNRLLNCLLGVFLCGHFSPAPQSNNTSIRPAHIGACYNMSYVIVFQPEIPKEYKLNVYFPRNIQKAYR